MYSDQSTQNDTNIISLHRFRDGRGLTPLRQVEAYWSALRHDTSTVPTRSQIDPRGLENILKYTFILERIAPGIAKFRLAGQHIVQLAGMEVRGMPLSTFFTPSGRIHLSAALEHVFDAPAVAELSLQGKPRHGRSESGPKSGPEARMMLLPLQTDSGDISRALGVLVADDVNAFGDLRLAVTNTELRPISGFCHGNHEHLMNACDQSEKPKPETGSHLRLVETPA